MGALPLVAAWVAINSRLYLQHQQFYSNSCPNFRARFGCVYFLPTSFPSTATTTILFTYLVLKYLHMGMECVQRSASPVPLSFNQWMLHHVSPSHHHLHHHHLHHGGDQSSSSGDETSELARALGLPSSPSASCLHPHSAPASSQLYSTLSCRRASSFPLALQQAALPSALKVGHIRWRFTV